MAEQLAILSDGPPPGLDLSACEREQIHTPGAVQPHGALIAALVDGGLVSHASANLLAIFGRSAADVLGQPLRQVIGETAWRTLQSARPGERTALNGADTPTGPDGQILHLHAYWTGRHIGVDIEPAHPEPGQRPPLTVVQSLIETFKHAKTKLELCELVIRGLREITGYDRIMVYRFGAQGHGEVVAEIHAPQMEPYLGHHYPTTDIPMQTRQMYLKQRVGAVADSAYEPVPLLVDPQLDNGVPLDLTYSSLRSVSPIQREFMRNMGTAATLSIGLAREPSELWGFILCHHETPRIASQELRAVVDMIGQVVSLLLGTLANVEVQIRRDARRASLMSCMDRLAAAVPMPEALASAETDLLRLVDATGAVVRIGGGLFRLGRTPPAITTERALVVMQAKAGGKMLAVDDLGLTHPELADCIEAGSGAFLLPLSDGPDDLILWFRPELTRVVTWAGDPNQHATHNPITGQIAPRASFAAWKQVSSGRSAPWTKGDLALGTELRHVVEAEVARRAKAELRWLHHYQELSDRLELKLVQRTTSLEVATSERAKAEATLHQSQKMEAIGQLTGGVAHDFNNVLAAVLGNLELAQGNVADPQVRRLLDSAQHAAERGAKLTDHLLSFARKQPLSREACDINMLIGRFDELIERTIGSAVLVRLDLAADLCLVMADPVQLEMALLNVSVNARDAMPKGGLLVITTRNIPSATSDLPSDLAPGDYACISVRDNGSGMSADIAEHVFEPFFTTKEPGRGTGLGLSQVYGFCKQLGGTATLSSTPGGGTCISLFLPRALEVAPPLPVRLPVAAPSGLRAMPLSTRVLAIDDDPDVLGMITETLQMLGFEVIAAGSGVRGLEILAGSARVDLVVTDFSMPTMNGIEFIHKARASQPGLLCLMVTGYADIGRSAAAAEAGIMILRKPFKMQELATSIQHLRDETGPAAQLGATLH